MLKNGLMGITFLLGGLVLVFGKFHFYIMIAGCALILIASIFFRKFQREMIRKTVEFTEKKRLENM